MLYSKDTGTYDCVVLLNSLTSKIRWLKNQYEGTNVFDAR
jgi:hypothetical protein